MNKSARSSRWFDAWRSEPVAEEDDAADHGTAFGLDMSFAAVAQALDTEAGHKPEQPADAGPRWPAPHKPAR